MKIPKVWSRADGSAKDKDGKDFRLTTWGWGDTTSEAAETARGRLEKIVSRLRNGSAGNGPGDAYGYGTLPVREEIVREVAVGNAPAAMVLTRNRYGALVLNTDDVLILDIDLPRRAGLRALAVRLGLSRDPAHVAQERLLQLVTRQPRLAFRLYRTAAGLRAIELNQAITAGSPEAETLMTEVGADPLYARLCRTQQSYRARLTPKPWRCGMPLPPGNHPREATAVRQAFANWLSRYEQHARTHAVCAFVDTLGVPAPAPHNRALVELHDHETHATASLPLA